jgi:hypothetical protein
LTQPDLLRSDPVSGVPDPHESPDACAFCRGAHESPKVVSWDDGHAISIDHVEGDTHPRIRASHRDRGVKEI